VGRARCASLFGRSVPEIDVDRGRQGPGRCGDEQRCPRASVEGRRAAGATAETEPGDAAVGRAAYYDVRFFRKGQLVFEAWPSRPRLQLPARWVHEGHSRSLVPGPYAWSVFPVFGSRANPRLGAAIVRSTWIAKR
jgi:hypothetical protein